MAEALGIRAAAVCAVVTACALAACVPLDVSRSAPDAILFEPEGAYARLFSPARHNFRYTLETSREPVRRGARAERFELRNGDCGGTDCGNDRARAEIHQTSPREKAQIGQERWYGWSFYNGTVPALPENESLRLVFGQWTVGGGVPPAIRLIALSDGEGDWEACDPRICAGPSRGSGGVVAPLMDVSRARDAGPAANEGYICNVFDLDATRRQWLDLVLHTNFSAGPDGFLRIWVDGELRCAYQGPIVSERSVAEGSAVEVRRGVFASYTKRWEARRGDTPWPTMVVYYDEFSTGARRSDVDVAMREANGRRPLD
ncbi:MAG: heparin lyase I family protein [Pseudomonadota bacterium]